MMSEDDTIPAWPAGDSDMARRVRAYDWAATPLGPVATWPQSLRTAVEIVLGSGHAMQLAWGPERIILYNDAYAPMLGERHPAALGKPFAAAWPDIWSDIAPLVERVFAGETVRFEEMPLVMTRHGFPEQTWWNFSYSPIRDESGAVAGLLNVTIDATPNQRAERAEAAVREREQSLRALTMAAAYSVYRMSPDWRLMFQLDSESLASTTAPIENWVEKYIPDDDMPAVRAAIDRAIRTKSIFELEHRVRLADGGIGWVLSRAVPLLDSDGDIYEWFGAGSDVTERREAAERLRESEEKHRTLFEKMGQGFALVELVRDASGRAIDQRYIEMNPAFERLLGVPVEDAIGKLATEVFPGIDPWWTETFARIIDAHQPERIEHVFGESGDWFEVYVYPNGDDRFITLYENITDRKRAEATLRESRERQRFLLKLADAQRPLGDPIAVQDATVRMLGEHLAVDRCYYAEFDWPHDVLHIHTEYRRSDAASAVGAHPISAFQDLLQFSHAGDPLVCDDIATHPIYKSEIAAYRARSTDGFILIPLIKHGVMVACMCVTMETPRRWTPTEIDLVRDVADRTWDAALRARTEAALADSEQWLHVLMAGIPQLVWRAIDGGRWTWASPQWADFTGQSDAGSHEFGWLDPVHPDDRERVLAIWAGAAARGEFHADYRLCHAAAHRYRWFQTRATPVRDPRGQVVEWLGTSTDVDDLRQLQDRQQVLVGELQHRVRNILTIVRSVFARTIEAGGAIDEVADHFSGRLASMARTQVIVTQDASGTADLENLIRDELLSVGIGDGPKVMIAGPEIFLTAKAAESIGLAIHELTTNAVKYGAFAAPTGRLIIRWQTNTSSGGVQTLDLTWEEQGVPAMPVAPSRHGFGRELIEEALPYRLGAETKLEFRGGGVRCSISLPLSVSGALAAHA